MKKNIVALVIIMSGFLAISSTIGFAEEIKITKIVPTSDVTRLKRVAVGGAYANKAIFPTDNDVPAAVALIEGQTAIGHGGSQGSGPTWLATGSKFPMLTLNSCERAEEQDPNYQVAYRKHSITMTNGANDYWHIASSRIMANPYGGGITGTFQIRQGDIGAGSDRTDLTIVNDYGYNDITGKGWIGVGTEIPRGKLDLNPTTGAATGALIVPRTTPGSISTPVPGMIIYNTGSTPPAFNVYEGGTTPGWKRLSTKAAS